MTSSGPLAPSPNCSSTAWKARKLVESDGSLAPSGRPRRIDIEGMAMISRAITLTRAVTMARSVDIRFTGAPAACGWPIVARALPLSRRVPTSPRMAGASVIATSTATATHTAPTVPMSPRNGTPVTLRASRATMTVVPAKTTAVPEVPVARPIDSRTGTPLSSCLRCRFTMNSE